jgi:hypothetical protein
MDRMFVGRIIFDPNAAFNHVGQFFFYLNHELENCYIKFIIFKCFVLSHLCVLCSSKKERHFSSMFWIELKERTQWEEVETTIWHTTHK